MFDFNPLYLLYLLIGVSAAMFAEGFYLLFYNKASYRKNINRRLKVMEDKPDRESVQLQLQSGLSIGFTRLMLFIAIGVVAAFVGTMTFDGKLWHAVGAALFCGLI